jgi:hypothetical protein
MDWNSPVSGALDPGIKIQGSRFTVQDSGFGCTLTLTFEPMQGLRCMHCCVNSHSTGRDHLWVPCVRELPHATTASLTAGYTVRFLA